MATALAVRLAIYFVVGGAIIAAIAYFSSLGRGFLAAFIATLPSTSLLTFLFTYLEGGSRAVTSYSWGLLLFIPAWVGYVVAVIFTLERIGIGKSLALGLAVFLALAWLTRLLARPWTA